MVIRVGLILEVTFVRLEEGRALDKWVFVERALQIMCRPLSHWQRNRRKLGVARTEGTGIYEGHEVPAEMEGVEDSRWIRACSSVQTEARYRLKLGTGCSSVQAALASIGTDRKDYDRDWSRETT